MAEMRASSMLTAVGCRPTNSSNGARPPPPPPNENPLNRPLLSVSRPSWVIRTESNVRKPQRKKPDPPCVVCRGIGRVDCHHCQGRGRTNFIDLAMLPKGEWPKWCKICGGSGLSYCPRCMGTGEYRYIMGFHFMKIDAERAQENKKYRLRDNLSSCSADLFLGNEPSDSSHTG